MKEATFKLELEVKIKYNQDESVPGTPYTNISGYVENNNLTLLSLEGSIADFTIKKFERKNENE